VIGVQYDFLKEVKTAKPARAEKHVPSPKLEPVRTRHSAPVIQPKPEKPQPKKYDVIISKSGFIEIKVSVSATNIAEAESKAQKEADAVRFKPSDIKTEVKSIVEA